MSVARWLRHRLIAVSGALPLDWIDAGLDHLAWAVDPERLPAARSAADMLGLTGEARRRFGQRAWAGNKRSDVLWTRLARDPSALGRLVVDTPVAAIARLAAERRGVILAAVHHGPVRVAAMTVVPKCASSSRLSLSVATESWLPPSSSSATPALFRRTTNWLYNSRA